MLQSKMSGMFFWDTVDVCRCVSACIAGTVAIAAQPGGQSGQSSVHRLSGSQHAGQQWPCRTNQSQSPLQSHSQCTWRRLFGHRD